MTISQKLTRGLPWAAEPWYLSDKNFLNTIINAVDT